MGTVVRGNGTVVNPGGTMICAQDYSQNYPDVASLGTNYLVVWMDDRIYHGGGSYIYGARINGSGAVAHGAPDVVKEIPSNYIPPARGVTSFINRPGIVRLGHHVIHFIQLEDVIIPADEKSPAASESRWIRFGSPAPLLPPRSPLLEPWRVVSESAGAGNSRPQAGQCLAFWFPQPKQ